MSDSAGPVRRRRIAGESKPAAPARKVSVKKAAVAKVPAKKVAVAKVPAKKVPAKNVTAKASTAKKGPATKAPAKKAAGTRATTAAPAASSTPLVPRPVHRPRPAESATASVDSLAADGWSRPPRAELRWLVPAVLVAAAVLVIGAVTMFTGVSQVRSGDDSLASSERQAASAAGTAAETIFSFRYDKLDEHLSASKALMTPTFTKDFDKIAPALTELAPQRKIVVQAVTRDAAALNCGDECSSTKANILVFIDQARLVGGSKVPTVFANRITVSMVKRGGVWLVDNIRAL
jgi:Mce-associated membrane protein